MKGKTVEEVGYDDKFLYVQMTNGERFRISWSDYGPVLDGIDVTIRLKAL